MIYYMAQRFLLTIPIALAVALVCFSLVHIAPGDPVTAFLPPQTPPEVVAQLKQAFGLDKPLPIQFWLWLSQIVQGNFGFSVATGRPVLGEVFTALSNTLIVAALATLIGVTLGCILGLASGLRRGTWIDRVATVISIAGVSVPHYWLGMVLVIAFSVQLNVLPAMGAGPGGSGSWAWDWDHLRYALLPAISMSVVPLSIIARTVKTVVAEILNQEFIQTLRAKGLGNYGVLKHVIKNAAPTSLAVIGLQVGYLLGGSILIETVFSWPGTGLLLNNAIFQRDLPLLQGTILVLAMLFVAQNLLVDILQALIDPRIKRF